MPAFALFMPLPLAIAATAVVHLANNLFKLALVGRYANWSVVIRFALPAMLAAIVGASLLGAVSGAAPLVTYELAGRAHAITPVKALVGAVIVIFAVLELTGPIKRMSFPPRLLPVGGLISGFFGGLSGNQGAFRSAFLLKTGLDRDAFVGTGAVSSTLVDLTRVAVYGIAFMGSGIAAADLPQELIAAAIVAAFAGSFLAKRLLEKVTMSFVRAIVATAMIAIGSALGVGLI